MKFTPMADLEVVVVVVLVELGLMVLPLLVEPVV
jgi:hypothetical protein